MLFNRTMGTELEYGFSDFSEPDCQDELLSYSLIDKWYQNHGSTQFILNGGRFYSDCCHPEYSTPECSDPFELAQYHLAGDYFMMEVFGSGGDKNKKIHIFRDNIDPVNNSYGLHENYLVVNTFNAKIFNQSLLPFLATRYILFGNGHVDQFGKFLISQRASVLDCVESFGYAMVKSRALINHRLVSYLPENLVDKYRRIHLVCGDANVSHWANILKFGVTSLVLSLLETDINLGNLGFQYYLSAIKKINSDLTFTCQLLCQDGKKRSALEIQKIYCDRVFLLLSGYAAKYKNVPKWCLEIHDLWSKSLESLSRFDIENISCNLTWIDWVAKYYLAKSWVKNDVDPNHLFSIFMDYHNINPNKSLAVYLNQNSDFIRPYFKVHQLQAATYFPSSHIRAKQRSVWVSRLLNPTDQYKNLNIDWVGVTIKNQLLEFDFPDDS